MFIKGKAFSNYDSNVSKKSKNYSTYYIDVDDENEDDVDLLNLVRGATLLTHGYAVSQPTKSSAMANEIGREQLNILAYEYCMPDSDYHKGYIPNTMPCPSEASYVQEHTRAFLDIIHSGSYRNKWIHPHDIEDYAEELKEECCIELDKKFPYLYGKKFNE